MNFEESNMLIDCKFDEMLDNYDEGYAAGKKEGNQNGYEAGKAEWYPKGYTAGYETGKTDWYNKGYLEGESNGLERGYESGKVDGKAEGITEGAETGKQEMFDLAWSCITNDGTRTVYEDAFSNTRVTPEFFRPPTTLIITGLSRNIFSSAYATEAIDGQALEEELGYPLFDTSGATNMQYGFYGSVFTTLGEIDIQKCTASQSTHYLFATSTGFPIKLKNIKKLKCSANTDWSSATFRLAEDLEHCIFEGTIGKNGLDVSDCTKLDYLSYNRVFGCLSSTTSGLAVTFSKAGVDRTFETSLGAIDGSTSADWLSLVASRNNWTINLV